MVVRRPDWWCYPERCANGHDWGPGLITVSVVAVRLRRGGRGQRGRRARAPGGVLRGVAGLPGRCGTGHDAGGDHDQRCRQLGAAERPHQRGRGSGVGPRLVGGAAAVRSPKPHVEARRLAQLHLPQVR
jgi:hypothetical protein